MRAVRVVALTLASAAALSAAPAPPAKGPALWAAISVNEPVVEWEVTGGPFTISFGLVNDGDKAVDPEVGQSQLLVNGKGLKDWGFIIGNGPRDNRWTKLPPGDYLSFGYDLGEH